MKHENETITDEFLLSDGFGNHAIKQLGYSDECSEINRIVKCSESEFF